MKILKKLSLVLILIIFSCKNDANKRDIDLLIGRNDYTTSSLNGQQIYILKKDKQKKVMNGYYIVGNKLKKWEEFEVKDGLLNGVYIIYHPDNGVIFNKQFYNNGILHGKDSTFYASGKIRTVKSYSNGKISGETFSFFENGQLQTKTKYKNEKAVESISYDNLGHITSQMFIKDGRDITQRINNGKVVSEEISSNYDDYEAIKLYNEDGSLNLHLRMVEDENEPLIIEMDENGNELKRINLKQNPQQALKYMNMFKDFMD